METDLSERLGRIPTVKDKFVFDEELYEPGYAEFVGEDHACSLIGVGVLALDGYKNLILQLTYIEIVRTLTTWLSLDGIGRDAGFAIVALYIVFGKLGRIITLSASLLSVSLRCSSVIDENF